LPLIIVFHSMGGGPDEFAPLFSRLSVPARVILPRGPESSPDGFAWWPASAYASPVTDERAIRNSSDRLARFIAAAQLRYRAPGPVVVSGMSQGGDLSFALALRYPDRIRAALPVAGRAPAAFWPGDSQAVFPPIDAFHGRSDTKAPFEPTDAAISALRSRAIPAVMHAYDGLDHDLSPREEQDLLECAEQRLRADLSPGACAR
jgi:predicted esterase